MSRILPALIATTLTCALSAAEVVAHRGASADAPENTIAAFKLAYEQGAHGVECDILRTSDGRVVMSHDKTTKRTTGVEGKVEEMTLVQLQALDAGSSKSPAFKGEKIPTLEESFAIIPSGRRLVVELKGGKELIPGIATALDAVKLQPAQVEFIGFSYDTLKAVKERFPQHRALLLASYKVDKETGKPGMTLEALIERCQSAKFDGMSISKDWPIDAAFCATVKAAKLDLYVWTINDPAEAKRLAALGMPVICTDKPKLLIETLANP
jgi:glycerophosphoryl diester phosphodiesterase